MPVKLWHILEINYGKINNFTNNEQLVYQSRLMSYIYWLYFQKHVFKNFGPILYEKALHKCMTMTS